MPMRDPEPSFLDMSPRQRVQTLVLRGMKFRKTEGIPSEAIRNGQLSIEEFAHQLMLAMDVDIVHRRLRSGKVIKTRPVEFNVPASPWHFFRWRHRAAWWSKLLTHWGRPIRQQTLSTRVEMVAYGHEIGFFPHAVLPPRILDSSLGVEVHGVTFQDENWSAIEPEITELSEERKELT